VPLDVPVPLDDPLVPVPLLVEPALFAPLVPELVPVLVRSELVPVFEPVFVRVRSVSLVLVPVLLGRVVGSLFVVLLSSRGRVFVFVPVSLLSHPTNAIPPNANAAATKIPCFFMIDLLSKRFPCSRRPRGRRLLRFTISQVSFTSARQCHSRR
jgi:hypothetical protein